MANTALARYNDTALKGIAEGYGATKSNVQEYYDDYVDTNTQPIESMVAKLQQQRVSSSDAGYNMADRLARSQKAADLRMEGIRANAQSWAAKRAARKEAERNYAAQRTQVADYNNQLLHNVKRLIAEQNANYIGSKWQNIINPFLLETEQDIRKDEETLRAAKLAKKNAELSTEMRDQQQAYLDKWQAAFDADPNKSQYADIEQWILSDPERAKAYNRAMADMGDEALDRRTANQLSTLNYGPVRREAERLNLMKKGGTTKRTFNEELALQQQRAGAKSSLQLEKSILDALAKIFK